MAVLEKFAAVSLAAAQRSSQALTTMARTPVEARIQRSELGKLSELSSALPSQDMILLSSRVTQDIQGVATLLFTPEAARALADLVLHRARGQTQSIFDAERSALEELANIVVGNVCTAFAQAAAFREVLHNAPVFSIGAVAAVVHQWVSPLTARARHEEPLLLSEILFEFQGSRVQGNLVLLLETPGLEAALARL